MKKRYAFKLRPKLHGRHFRITVFAGFVNQTLANCGVLTMDVGEWQTFRALLHLGAAYGPSPDMVTVEDEKEKSDDETSQCLYNTAR